MLTIENLDFYLSVTGFVFPRTEEQLDLFDRLYEDYDYQLKGVQIDCQAIIENRLKPRTTIRLENDFDGDAQGLKMAARKGLQQLPDDVIKKMYGKHPKKPGDKE